VTDKKHSTNLRIIEVLLPFIAHVATAAVESHATILVLQKRLGVARERVRRNVPFVVLERAHRVFAVEEIVEAKWCFDFRI
jgi:hypothetical protein